MQKTKSIIQFDKEMQVLAINAYNPQHSILDGWIQVAETNNYSGFFAKAFLKNNIIVISIRGTNDRKDVLNDIEMLKKQIPNQYNDAQSFYLKIKNYLPNHKIIFTGHSLGGSLAQLMGYITNCETITFNAYGTSDLLDDGTSGNLNIRNYGNINDSVFIKNIDCQIGKTYIIMQNYNDKYITKDNIGYLGGLDPFFHHSIENMGNIEKVVEYKKQNPYVNNNLLLVTQIEKNIDYKDIDHKRIITREELAKMPLDKYSEQEEYLYELLNLGNIMSQREAEQKFNNGELIWVDDYFRDDGTHVSGYYRRK